jgi:hypothetical protein
MKHTISVDDQRRHPRNTFRQSVEFAAPYADNESGWHRGQAVDLSFGGLRLISSLRLREGEGLQLRLQQGTGHHRFVTSARVVHARLDASGRWVLGCEFVP